MKYDWPGNEHELKSALEYSFAIGASGLLALGDLPPQFQGTKVSNFGKNSRTHPTAKQNDPPEKIQLIDALRMTGGNQSQAARLLGVHRMTVFNRMRKYGVNSKNFE